MWFNGCGVPLTRTSVRTISLSVTKPGGVLKSTGKGVECTPEGTAMNERPLYVRLHNITDRKQLILCL